MSSERRPRLVPAWILSARPYGDSSLLLEAFTAEFGRQGLIARGARGGKARNRVHYQPFRRLLLGWDARGDLGRVTGVEPDAPPLPLAGDALFCGWYVNELLVRLTHRHDPHPELFSTYGLALARLVDAVEPALRDFELDLLTELGYGLDLDQDWVADVHYRFDAEGQVTSAPVGAADAVSGACLRAMAERDWRDPALLREARKLLRQRIALLLGGRPLRSVALIRQMKGLGQSMRLS